MSEKRQTEKYISDYINSIDQFDKGKFNLIAAPTGSGKTTLCKEKLWEIFPFPKERVLLVTSRAMIADQLTEEGFKRYYGNDYRQIQIWNGVYEECIPEEYRDGPFGVMTYDVFVKSLKTGSWDKQVLSAIDLVVFDECHCLFFDTFIKGMDTIKVWMRHSILAGERYIIGLTATPEIVREGMETDNVPVKEIRHNGPLVRHKASCLRCLGKEDVEELLRSDSLQGQTLVMCVTVSQCQELCSKVPGSAMLVSKHRNEYTKEMDNIRKTIIKEKRLPDTFTVVEQETGERLVQPLRVLVATSTIREGFSLKENSNVRNIVSYFVDQVSIVQLLGRCRYDVDNLIIAGKGTGNNWDQHPYTKKYRELYKEFLNGKNRYWFRSIQNVVKCSFDQIVRSITPEERKAAARAKNVEAFVEWLKERYLSVEAPSDGIYKKWKIDRRIRLKVEGVEIAEMAGNYRIMKETREHTARKVLNFIKNEIDELDVKSSKSDGIRYYWIVEKLDV